MLTQEILQEQKYELEARANELDIRAKAYIKNMKEHYFQLDQTNKVYQKIWIPEGFTQSANKVFIAFILEKMYMERGVRQVNYNGVIVHDLITGQDRANDLDRYLYAKHPDTKFCFKNLNIDRILKVHDNGVVEYKTREGPIKIF